MDDGSRIDDATQIGRLHERIRVMSETMRAFAAATPDHERLLVTIAQNLARVVGDTCSLRILSDDGEVLEPVAIEARDPEVARRIREHPSASLRLDTQPRLREALLSGEAVVMPINPEVLRKDTDRASGSLVSSLGTHCAMLVPLRLHGSPIGMLSLSRVGASPAFDEHDRDLAVNLAEQAALAIGNARLLRAARRAESRFARLADAGIVGILVADLTGRVSEVNDVLLAMIGRTRTEVLTGAFRWRDLTPPEWHEVDALALEQLRCMGVSGLREKEYLRSDGARVPVLVGTAMLDGAGDETISFILDLTETRHAQRAAAALRKARETAEAANRELEAFSYSVAHDLRAPLRGVSGFASVLLDDYASKLDAEGVDCLQEIQSNAAKMGALIDALLSLSRVTRIGLRPHSVDLSALARAVGAQLAAAEPGRDVELVVEDGLVAEVDAALARSVFDNLLGNAWKFTGRVAQARVEFGSTVERGLRTFWVRDNGAGFDAAHASKLFAPFQRLHGAGEFPGTGIGLATVQRIIHRHGGRVWADGRPGAGATFSFTLPLRAAEALS